ncbi:MULTISPECIES: hypothetical protein [Streptomyces]|uniref:hypothetical protein n=1 Tax=Streptomyces TaxID=1883 RepID=UPI001416CFA9|nr:hypothetical protein [Streptomyces sp. SID7805]MYU54101.1 hypothetical protein [Streptomyces sp. SID7805]
MDDSERDEVDPDQEAALAELVANAFDAELWGKALSLAVISRTGEGKTEAAHHAQILLAGHHGVFKVRRPAPFQNLLQRQGRTHRAVQAAESARKRYRKAAGSLKVANTLAERRRAARAFLAALAELVACLLGFLVSVLLLLLSRLLGCITADDLRVWKPAPIETTPQIAPRGPNPAFPVYINRGGHHRSTLGSVVLAA